MKHLNLSFSLLLVLATTASLSAQKKIVLTTYNSHITDAVISFIAPDVNWGKEPHMWCYAWTQDGDVNITRPLLQFDLSDIPAGSTAAEALLILHYDPYTHWFGKHSGLTNFSIRRITAPWDELTVTWNNQPTTTGEHEISIPPASFDQQNYVVNVTDLVNDMLNEGNNGFMFKLENEFPYSVVRLAGADHADVSLHPQLWLTLDDSFVGTNDDHLKSEADHFTVGPNPTSGELFVSSKTVPKGANTAEVYDAQGKRVLSQALTGSYSYLYLNLLPNGMYVLKIFNDTSGYIQEEKIVLAK